MERIILTILTIGTFIAIGWGLYEFPNEVRQVIDSLVKSHSEMPLGFE